MPVRPGNAAQAQRLLLRSLLWLLALAAVAGVLAVFFSTNVMGRIAGSGLLAAVACGLASPIARFLDSDEKRRAGLVGLCAVISGFLLGLAAIWIGVVGLRGEVEWQLTFTALVAVVGGLIACLLLLHSHRPAARVAALAGITVVSAAAAAFLVAIWYSPGYLSTGDDLQEHFAMTGWYTLLCGTPLAVCLIGAGARDRAWRWAGVTGAGAAWIMALAGVWLITSKDPTWFVAALALGIVIAHANAAARVNLGEAGVWARLVAVGSMAVTGLCIVALAHLTGFESQGPDWLVKGAGASGIVALCSTIGLIILYRLNRRVPGVSANIAEIASVQVACPCCGARRAAPLGPSACESCGLVLAIAVREPRCPGCDYSLLHLKGAVCPECGQPVGAP